MSVSEPVKKRKRSAPLPTEASSSKKLKVTHLETNSHPVIASTPGIKAPQIPFQAFTRPRNSKDGKKEPTPATHDILLHSSAHPTVDYTAAPTPGNEQLRHYIAILDEESKTLQIIPAYHATLRAAPRKRAPINEEAERKARATYAAQREALGKEFGTKKAQKLIASRTENAIVKKDSKGKGKRDEVQDAILEAMADDEAAASPVKKEEVLDELMASKPIPRPNMEAENVEDVYTFDTLVPPDAARLLQVKDWQDKALASEPIMFQHRFPAHRASSLCQTDQIPKIKALRYLTLLLEFHDALQNAGRSGGKKVPKKEILTQKLRDWPENLIDSVRRRFADEKNELPKWYMERLYTHLCALSLFIDDWKSNTSHLRDDLRMENKQISQYFFELGAKFTPPTEKDREGLGLKSKAQAAAVRIARLRLPLEFPKPRVGRKR